MGEGIVAALAREILTLNEELAKLDALISEKVTEHQHTEVLLSMPGFGPVLAAEFLGATGGDLTVFQSADRFAGVVGTTCPLEDPLARCRLLLLIRLGVSQPLCLCDHRMGRLASF